VKRSKLGLATGLGLSVLSYAALVGWARRALVADPPLGQLESALQSSLAETGLVATDRYVHTPVGRVHVLLAGQGESTVVVLPGLGASAGDFADLLARLARRHLVVAIDLPGGGLSDPIGFRGHPRPAWNEVITAVTDQIGIARFTLVGHSLGGLAAGGFAIAYPERVERLILISPVGFSRRVPLSWNLALAPGWLDLLALYQRAALSHRGGRSRMESAEDRYRRLVGLRLGHASDLATVARLIQPGGLRPESRLLPALGVLSGRVLVVWGSDDRKLPVRDAQPELDYFKGIRLEVVQGAGHLLPVADPDLTARLITDFVGAPRD
jgi:pimeloyl-ACP methyl ester carboxylesterase